MKPAPADFWMGQRAGARLRRHADRRGNGFWRQLANRAGGRALGLRVLYGDATRMDLLRTAGAASARVLVVAVDSIEQSLKIVDLAKEHFPQLRIVARARDVTHWNQLRDRGVQLVERELFESSLRSARTVLELLGHPAHEARQSAMRFRKHNIEFFEKMYPHRKDRSKVIAMARQGRLQL